MSVMISLLSGSIYRVIGPVVLVVVGWSPAGFPKLVIKKTVVYLLHRLLLPASIHGEFGRVGTHRAAT